MPKTVDHDERRAQLTEATARQIAGVGLERVRLRDVASAAGWTTGAVGHYFGDKRELLLATFRSRTAMARADVRRRIAAGETELEAGIEAILPLDEERTLTWKVWLAFWGAAVGDDELADEQRRRYELFRAGLERAVRAEQAAGRIAIGVDAEHESRLLATLVDGIAVQALFAPEQWPPDVQRRVIADHLASLTP